MIDSGSRMLFFNPSHNNMFFLDPAFPGEKPVLTMELDGSKKRPFFSSPELDYFDDEYHDDQLTEKKRRLTPQQVNLLERSFEAENKLEPDRKTQLADKLGLQPRQVAVWFQNRRARWKTKQLERDYDLLKASYDSLLTTYQSTLTEHNKLKTQVASLTEKLKTKEVVVAKEPESFQVDLARLNAKAEDRLSPGTAGSGVVDLDSPQVLDSGNSFFQTNNDYAICGITGHSEEEDGSDDCQSYFSDVFVEAGRQQQQEVEEPLGWWMWS